MPTESTEETTRLFEFSRDDTVSRNTDTPPSFLLVAVSCILLMGLSYLVERGSL